MNNKLFESCQIYKHFYTKPGRRTRYSRPEHNLFLTLQQQKSWCWWKLFSNAAHYFLKWHWISPLDKNGEVKLLRSGMKHDGHDRMKSPELVPVLRDTWSSAVWNQAEHVQFDVFNTAIHNGMVYLFIFLLLRFSARLSALRMAEQFKKENLKWGLKLMYAVLLLLLLFSIVEIEFEDCESQIVCHSQVWR